MPMVRMRPGRRGDEPPAGMGGFGRRPRPQRLGRRVRQLNRHVCSDLIFRPQQLHLHQLYKRILRECSAGWGEADPNSRDRLHILNSCMATVTDGWYPTAAPITGVGTARPVCCCGPRGPTEPPRCCCSIGRCGAIRAVPGVCRAAPGTAMRSAEETAVREAHEEAGLSAERLAVRATVVTAEFAGIGGTQLDLHHRRRRCRRVAAHRAQPGKRRVALGRRGRGGRPAAASRLRRQLATAAHGPGDRAAGPRRRTPPAPAAHAGDRGRGLHLVHAGRRGPGAVAAESDGSIRCCKR